MTQVLTKPPSRYPKALLLSCFLVAAFVLLFGDCAQAAKNRLSDIRHWSSPTFTRVVLDLQHEARYDSFSLSGPDRLVIDLKDFGGSVPRSLLTINDGIVKTIRASRNSGNTIRIVLDLQKKSEHTIFPLKKIGKKPPRLVVDINRRDLEQAAANKREKVRKHQKGLGDVIVVIDPGHGGEDPGAVSRRGTMEKDIVFAIAKKTVDRLNRRKGIKAYLTRKGDYFIPLRKRIDIAKQYGADMFISIHADSSFSKRAAGSSVYCLSFKGASSNTAKMVAKKENASDFIGGVPLDHGNGDLSAIIFDLVQTHSLNSSLQLAGITLAEIAKTNRLHTRKTQQANFAVLRAPDIPSILIETDFISNPSREKRMKTASFQNDFSKRITTAVEKFLSGAKETKLFAQPDTTYHVVKRGDTLSGIAQRYKLAVSELRQMNGLSGRSTIKIGQKLKVPYQYRETPAPKPKRRPTYHVVKRGDTLSGIALKYGTTVSAVRKLNRMSSRSTLMAGKKLKIPASSTKKKSPAYRRHIVKRGDTLSDIALKYGTTVSAVRKLNRMSSRSTLMAGKKLKIPASSTKKKSPAYRRHIVKRGDTLSGIALKYGTTVSSVRKLNRMSSRSTLRIGKKLKIPPRAASSKYTYHTVKRGETLSGIALKYGTTVAAIRKLNRMSSRSVLKAGNKLKIHKKS